MCESQELIVGYVYDELPPGERAAFEAHMASCAQCRGEIAELQSTRACLSLWAPPEPDLGFRVIRGGAAPAAALPRRSRLVPAFAFAAAAVIVLAVAAAIANIEVRYGNEGMTVRTGWVSGAPGAVPGTGDAAAEVTAASADFEALSRRLTQIEATLAVPAGGMTVTTAAGARLSDAEILRRVRQLVAEAEARQETAVASRLLDVVRDFDRQRRTDLVLLQQGLGQYQGLTNAEIAQNRDMLNQLVRAAATRQEK